MKATGIVRRIDDLGRIVIPKEIRRTMRIREGDPLEIYINRDGEVIFKKYSLLAGLEDFSADLCETVSRATGKLCAMTDRDAILAVAGGGKRELADRRISPALEKLLASRSFYQYDGAAPALPAADRADKYLVTAAAPIVSQGDLLGALLLLEPDPTVPGELDCRLLQSFAAFLGRHLEE